MVHYEWEFRSSPRDGAAPLGSRSKGGDWMDGGEVIVLLLSLALSGLFLYGWYRSVFGIWPMERNKWERTVLALLPFFSMIVFFYALTSLASFDVVGSPLYIFFYVLLGFAWMYLSVFLFTYFFDLSWKDDILNNCNKSALIAFSGGFLGLALIYAGANIGDGPGWWCVVFAGGLGLVSWIVFTVILHITARVFERITVERDVGCGIRTGSFLLAIGIILARASAGDWTSASMTVVEFLDGWPAVLLTLCAIGIERFYLRAEKNRRAVSLSDEYLTVSVCLGLLFILFAILCTAWLPPLPVNPVYG